MVGGLEKTALLYQEIIMSFSSSKTITLSLLTANDLELGEMFAGKVHA